MAYKNFPFRKNLKGLYILTDEVLTPYAVLIDLVTQALEGGASIVQLRDKHSPDEKLLPIAIELKCLCESFGAIFIVNDRVELAHASDAHGVHLGRDDGSVARARRRLGGNKIIGVSCYNELERARALVAEGADYVAFGSFYPSPTKPDAVRAELEIISLAKKELGVPVCAIGGITIENAKEVVGAGADMIAVVSGLWKQGQYAIREMAREFSRFFHS